MKRWTAVVLLALAGGCVVDGPGPVGPDEERSPCLRLPAGELGVYERDTVTVRVEGAAGAAGLRVQLLVLDSARRVLWRSAATSVTADLAEVPISGIPAAVERGAAYLVTGLAVDGEGQRTYASDDSSSVARLEDAATRPARVWTGRRVRAGAGDAPVDLAVAAELERAFFPLPGDGAIGVLDLSGDGVVAGMYPVGARPARVAYRGGVLAVLGAGGGELGFFTAGPGGLPVGTSQLLRPLEVEVDSTFAGAVRPSGRGLALGCDGPGCERVFAVVPSGLQVLAGSVSQPEAAGALRVVPAAPGPTRPPLVLPGYEEAVLGDTSGTATVFGPADPGGARQLLQRRDAASVCLTAALGGGLVAAAPEGVVFVATTTGGAEPPCGPGTGLVRIEGVGTAAPAISALAVRNTLAEDRIGHVVDLQVSDDGRALLVLGDDGVVVLDAFLRVRGTLSLPDVRAVAWLRGGPSDRFVAADPRGVKVYDATRLVPLATLAVGPTAGPLAFLRRSSGPDVVAAAIAGGFVIASAPAQ